MKCEAIHELLTQYLLGDLPPNVSDELQAHLQDCDGCRAEAAEIESTLDLLRDALAATSSVPASMEKSHYEKIYSAGNSGSAENDEKRTVVHHIGTWFTTYHHQLAAAVAMICIGGILLGVSMVQFGGVMSARRQSEFYGVNLLEGEPASNLDIRKLEETAEIEFEEVEEIEPIEEITDELSEQVTVSYGGRAAGKVLAVSGAAFEDAGGAGGGGADDSFVSVNAADPFAGAGDVVNGSVANLDEANRTIVELEETVVERDEELYRLKRLLSERPADQDSRVRDWSGEDPFGAVDEEAPEPTDSRGTLKLGFAAKPPSLKSKVTRWFSKADVEKENADVSSVVASAPEPARSVPVSEAVSKTERESVSGKMGKGGGGALGLGGLSRGIEAQDELSKAEVKNDSKAKRKSESRKKAVMSFGSAATVEDLGRELLDRSVDLPSTEEAPSPPSDFSPQPAEFDSVAIVKSPVIMTGIYGSRSPGARGAAIAAYGGNASGEATSREESESDVGVDVVLEGKDGYYVDEDGDGLVALEDVGSVEGFSDSVSAGTAASRQSRVAREKKMVSRDQQLTQLSNQSRPVIVDEIGGADVTHDAPARGDRLLAGTTLALDSNFELESGVANEREEKQRRRNLVAKQVEQEARFTEVKSLEGKDADKEVYYRYLPNFKAETEKANKPAASQPKPKRVAKPQKPAEPEEDLTGPKFRAVGLNKFVQAVKNAFSTFAIDVDTASYTLGRNYMLKGFLPPAESVRTEEYVNFFDYGYEPPTKDTFKIYTECAPSKFGHGMHMLKIGVKGRAIGREEKQSAKLTFVIDSSGSMNQLDRMGLLKKSIAMLLDELTPEDEIAIVQFGSKARLVLEHTSASEKKKIMAAINSLQTSGSTNLEEAMLLAYQVAAGEFKPGASNRVLIMSDGAANIGEGAAQDILNKVKKYSKQGIYCSVFGFGIGTYNDEMLETLANKGNGTYNFVDSETEAKRLFVDELSATLNTIASDVKIQVEFMPRFVKQYRQLGYENRQLTKKQFRDNTVDAGEVGSGQSVTALYELELNPSPELYADLIQCMAVVRVRYRRLDTGAIEEIEKVVSMKDIANSFNAASPKFRLACAVAEFAEILRGSIYAAGSEFKSVAEVLRPIALEFNLDKRIRELTDMVQNAGGMSRGE